MQTDLYKPIPTIAFPENKIPVAYPVNDSFMYLDHYFACDSQYNHWKENQGKPLPGSSSSILARKTVVDMLLKAEKELPKGFRFKIYDAYRPIAVQQTLWDYYRKKIKKANPDQTEKEIDRLTSFCVSYPSYNILEPSLHNTGGAVDLTIIDENGKELDMGCEFDDFTEKAWTNHFEPDYKDSERNNAVKNNRRMLYNVMISVGFTNLPSEWWHYDYGDDKWAQLNHTAPLYCGVLDVNAKNTVAYPNMDKIREISREQYELSLELAKMREKVRKLAEQISERQ